MESFGSSGMIRLGALIADDHGMYRAGISALLRDAFDFQDVACAASLSEALAALAGLQQISLALFDLSMPGMSGPSSLAQLRKKYPKLIIAVISASEERHQVLEALASGLNGFIPKSLSNEEIVAAIAALLGGGIYVPKLIIESESQQATDRGKAQFIVPRAASLEPQAPTHITSRQRDVLEFVRKGLTNKEIARHLAITEGTVKVHVACLLTSFRVRNRTQLALR